MDQSATPFRPGDLIKGRYAVLAVCGAGGMGSIYRVRDIAKDNQEAALKVLNPSLIAQDESAAERFRREAVIAAGLKHPNIVEVYDFSLDPSGPMIIAMEYVDGVSLAQRISNREISKLSMPQIVRILKDIASGLAFAHERGVIHRDLKPANILLGPNGAAKIADFGLCRSDIFEKGLTQAGECVGTPLYMAPEQITSGKSDATSDIYSFGILAYEMLSGNVPFNGDTWFEIAEKHLLAPLPELSADAPDTIRELLKICTEKNPAKRFSSGAELFEWLSRSSLQAKAVHLFADEPRRDTVYYAAAAACVFFLVTLGISSGVFRGGLQQIRNYFHHDAEPLPPSVFEPSVNRSAPSNGAAQQGRSPGPGSGASKVYVCLNHGVKIFTTDPPANANCLEAR